MRYALPSEQMQLLSVRPEYRIEGNAHARNAYGAAAQEIVCAALNLRPIPINGACEVCFDAADRSGGFYEIKSVHRSGKVVVYDWRMQKEAAAGDALLYAILVHRVRLARTSAAMWSAFLSRGLEILLLPASAVHEVAKLESLRKVASVNHPDGARMGYNRKGYRDGYRNLSLAALRAFVPCERVVSSEVYGEPFAVSVWSPA